MVSVGHGGDVDDSERPADQSDEKDHRHEAVGGRHKAADDRSDQCDDHAREHGGDREQGPCGVRGAELAEHDGHRLRTENDAERGNGT